MQITTVSTNEVKLLEEVKFCGKCGSRLLTKKIGAEEIIEYFLGHSCRPYTAYDRETGERNEGIVYFCPNKSFMGGHDERTKYITKVQVVNKDTPLEPLDWMIHG